MVIPGYLTERPVSVTRTSQSANAPLGTFRYDSMATDATLESEAKVLDYEEKAKFLAFIKRTLQWRPEDRASAAELLQDPWISWVNKRRK